VILRGIKKAHVLFLQRLLLHVISILFVNSVAVYLVVFLHIITSTDASQLQKLVIHLECGRARSEVAIIFGICL
jgi:hypothetical protein